MENENIVRKIKKLIALSSSPNESEAISASLKAQKLAIEYNLELSSISVQSDSEISETVALKSKSFPRWEMILITGIASVNFCQILEIGYHCSAKEIKIVGKKHNTLIVIELHKYLVGAIKRITKLECSGMGRKYHSSFKMGVSCRIVRKINEKFEQTKKTTESNGLVIIETEETKKINQYFEDKHGNSKTKNNSFSVSDNSGFNDGLLAAESIGIDQQID